MKQLLEQTANVLNRFIAKTILAIKTYNQNKPQRTRFAYYVYNVRFSFIWENNADQKT